MEMKPRFAQPPVIIPANYRGSFTSPSLEGELFNHQSTVPEFL